jgi:high-affinity iron transporter
LGWTNSATYGSVISYNLYWLVVISGFLAMRYQEVNGHWPLMKPKAVAEPDASSQRSESDLEASAAEASKTVATEKSTEIPA